MAFEIKEWMFGIRIWSILDIISGVFAAREYGASMMGNLMLTWFARNSQESDARWAIIMALFVYDAIGVIITLVAILAGALNSLAWLVMALYLFLALGFGYFLLPKRKT